MAALNYPEMLQQVKVSIFTGDHSAIYSLACAVACIAASFSLITWYNKMMNDPYGRLDMRAIVRALIILFCTCNFYNFVLVPFDRITYLVTRGISASVDEHHKEGYDVKEIIRQIESSRGGETYLGLFREEMEGALGQVSDSGLSGESSSVLESEAELAVSDRPRKSLGLRLWQTCKDVVSTLYAVPVYGVGSVLSGIISVVVKIVQWLLLSVSNIILIILGMVGPFVFALSLLPGFKMSIRTWVARYLQISFWCPMAALVDYVNYKMTGAMVTALFNAPISAKGAYSIHVILLEVVVLLCLLGVPTMASWVVSGAGSEELNNKIASTAQKAVTIASKL